MIILPLDPHLVDAADKFEDLGYLQTINGVVEINHSHQPPPHPLPPPRNLMLIL